MKNLLLLITGLFAVVACDVYTVKNNWISPVKAGDVNVNPGECIELSDHLFGLLGDFPIRFTKLDDTELEGSAVYKKYEANNWEIKSPGTVVEAKESCKVESTASSPLKPNEN